MIDAGYGLADRATRTPNGPTTIFQVGSVTKQFTAMAIAILAQQSKLRLDGRVRDCLPSCPHSWRPITIVDLLTHTSGIADWSTWNLTCPLPREATDPIGAIVTHAEAESLAFQPGTRAAYSNPGYVVLGEIIQHKSGMSYAGLLARACLCAARDGSYRCLPGTARRTGPCARVPRRRLECTGTADC